MAHATSSDYAGTAAEYQAAFLAYELAVKPGHTVELAQRIRAEEPAFSEALLVALDYWAYAASRARTEPSAAELLALAEAADNDAWRKRNRAARDQATLRKMSVEARQLSLPPSILELLALRLRDAGEYDEAVALLRWARGHHPADLWIPCRLGSLLLLTEHVEHTPPLDIEEAIGCFRVALALSPEASLVHNNLGLALKAKNQLDEAITEFNKAIQLDPKNAKIHTYLGSALFAKNRLDEAIAECSLAIELDPRFAGAHNNLGLALEAKNRLMTLSPNSIKPPNSIPISRRSTTTLARLS